MIPVSLVRQYLFCPRIVYFVMLTDVKPIYPKHVELGLKYHEVQETLSKNRKFKKLKIDFEKILIDEYLEDSELGIYGKIDVALLTKDEVVPIEFKWRQNKKPTFAHILQLYGYGVLLEKKYEKKFQKEIIIHSNNLKLHIIEVTKKHHEYFFKIVEDIQHIINTANFPDSSANEAKCLQCEYLNFCDDRF